MRARLSLERQITIGLIVYTVLLSVGLILHGLMVNERAERMVWEAMLATEMDHVVERRQQDPGYRWRDTRTLELFVEGDPRPMPDALAGLAPGLHDNVVFEANEWVVLVRDVRGTNYALALDIDGFEADEWALARPVIASSLLVVLLLSIAIYFGARLLANPLRGMAHRITALQPDAHDARLEVPPRASIELSVIADALNDYLSRNAQFVSRERDFIDTASHELRTPIAVIAGAAELARGHAGTPLRVEQQLRRIAVATHDVEQLISLLLVLAKEPSRMRAISDDVALDQLLPTIVADHRYLCADKDLTLTLGPLQPCTLRAPEAVLRASIGNLLRNAIEHSDSGEIRIDLDGACVSIRDPGHGMSPEEISAIYARMARDSGARGAGIGLALIARLCEHLGWTLRIESESGRGTTASLDLGTMRLD